VERASALCRFAPIPPQLHAELALRHRDVYLRTDLSRDAWVQAMEQGCDSDVAWHLLSRDLDDDQLALALAKERRQVPLAVLFDRHGDRLDADQLATLASRARGKLAATMLPHVPVAQRPALAAHLDVAGRLGWMADTPVDELGDEELAQHLGDASAWIPDSPSGAKARNAALELLVHLRLLVWHKEAVEPHLPLADSGRGRGGRGWRRPCIRGGGVLRRKCWERAPPAPAEKVQTSSF